MIILLQTSEPAIVLGELLDALEIIIVETASMETEILDFFSQENANRNRRNRSAWSELQPIQNNNRYSQLSPYILQDNLVFTTVERSISRCRETASSMRNLINQLRGQIQ